MFGVKLLSSKSSSSDRWMEPSGRRAPIFVGGLGMWVMEENMDFDVTATRLLISATNLEIFTTRFRENYT